MEYSDIAPNQELALYELPFYSGYKIVQVDRRFYIVDANGKYISNPYVGFHPITKATDDGETHIVGLAGVQGRYDRMLRILYPPESPEDIFHESSGMYEEIYYHEDLQGFVGRSGSFYCLLIFDEKGNLRELSDKRYFGLSREGNRIYGIGAMPQNKELLIELTDTKRRNIFRFFKRK